MKGTRAFVLGVGTNYLRLFVSVGVFFFLTPVILETLGAETYALWTLITSVVAFFGLLEMGFGTAVLRFAKEWEDPLVRPKLAGTLLGLHLGLSLAAVGGTSLLALFLGPLLGISPEDRGTAVALLWLFSFRQVVLYLPGSLFRNLLLGWERTTSVNLVQIATTVLYGAGAWLCLAYGGTVVDLAWVYLVCVAVELLSYVLLCRSRFPRIRFRDFDPKMVGRLSSFGVWAFATQVSGLILLKTDPLIVQAFLPLSAVAVYGIAMTLGQQAFLLFKQFTNLLAPLASRFGTVGDLEKLRFLLVTGTRIAMVPAGLVLSGTLVFGPALILLWVGSAYQEAALVLILLVLVSALLIPQLTASAVLSMTGHHRLTGSLSLLSAGVNLVASVLLVQVVGLIGVALGTLVAVLTVDLGLLVPRACRLNGVSLGRYLLNVGPSFFVPLVCGTAAHFGMSLLVPPLSWGALALGALPGVLIYLLVFWFGFTPGQERALLKLKA